jgi:hypothetical protein
MDLPKLNPLRVRKSTWEGDAIPRRKRNRIQFKRVANSTPDQLKLFEIKPRHEQ